MITSSYKPEKAVLSTESITDNTVSFKSNTNKTFVNFDLSANLLSPAIKYYLKHFLFSIIIFSTLWSMAQQPLPEKRTTVFFPNISSNSISVQYAENTATITVDKLEDIRPGDKIRILDKDKSSPFDAIVSSVRGNYFTVEGLSREKYGDQVYVLGKEVTDFRTVDYDAISILNYSSTQKLTKQVAEQKVQIETLQKEIGSLKTSMDKMVVLLEEQNKQLSNLKGVQIKDVNTQKSEVESPADSKSSGFIPNINKKASSVVYSENAIVLTIDKLNDVRPGDKVLLYNHKNESFESVVSSVNGDCLTLEALPYEKFGQDILVYGKQVEDFDTVGL